jgi:solute carrier family 25 protein 38
MGPTVLTNAPFSALYYMFYTKLKGVLSEAVATSNDGEQKRPPQAAVNFVSGVFAATVATLLTQPTDVVRTRMQLGFAARGNSWATFTQALKTAGPQALLIGGFRGTRGRGFTGVGSGVGGVPDWKKRKRQWEGPEVASIGIEGETES